MNSHARAFGRVYSIARFVETIVLADAAAVTKSSSSTSPFVESIMITDKLNIILNLALLSRFTYNKYYMTLFLYSSFTSVRRLLLPLLGRFQ